MHLSARCGLRRQLHGHIYVFRAAVSSQGPAYCNTASQIPRIRRNVRVPGARIGTNLYAWPFRASQYASPRTTAILATATRGSDMVVTSDPEGRVEMVVFRSTQIPEASDVEAHRTSANTNPPLPPALDGRCPPANRRDLDGAEGKHLYQRRVPGTRASANMTQDRRLGKVPWAARQVRGHSTSCKRIAFRRAGNIYVATATTAHPGVSTATCVQAVRFRITCLRRERQAPRSSPSRDLTHYLQTAQLRARSDLGRSASRRGQTQCLHSDYPTPPSIYKRHS